MKKLLTALTLFLSVQSLAQGGFVFGFNGITYNHETLQAWSESYTEKHNLIEAIEVPKMGLGFVAGMEFYNNGWNMGMNFVWNRRVTNSTQLNLYGEEYNLRTKIKFNHLEMPFFYFIADGPIGLGLTADFGRQKLVLINESEDGIGVGGTPMNQVNIASKLGLKFRSSSSGSHLQGMIYFQIGGVFETILTDWETNYLYKQKSIGVRLCWVLGA